MDDHSVEILGILILFSVAGFIIAGGAIWGWLGAGLVAGFLGAAGIVALLWVSLK